MDFLKFKGTTQLFSTGNGAFCLCNTPRAIIFKTASLTTFQCALREREKNPATTALFKTQGWFTRATQTQAQAQGSSHVQRKRKHSAIRKRNGVFQDGRRSRCIGVVVLSLSWSSSNKT